MMFKISEAWRTTTSAAWSRAVEIELKPQLIIRTRRWGRQGSFWSVSLGGEMGENCRKVATGGVSFSDVRSPT